MIKEKDVKELEIDETSVTEILKAHLITIGKAKKQDLVSIGFNVKREYLRDPCDREGIEDWVFAGCSVKITKREVV